MNESESAIVIELAKEFIELVRSLDSNWTKAFYRFRSDEDHFGSNASYLNEAGVNLIGAIRNGPFYESMNKKGANLLNLMNKERGVFLLSVDKNFDYEIKFEWSDIDRWKITKADGGTGVPEGS